MIYVKKAFLEFEPGYFYDERSSRVTSNLFGEKGHEVNPEDYFEVIEPKKKQYKLTSHLRKNPEV